ncbi:MAG: PH domain-containing protein, partial [Bifidobacteriaceae bacterium]|nr:PH domain-containing protein [Bifidobacteriaceae bacterium]
DEETVRKAIWAVAPALADHGTWDMVAAAMTGTGPTPGFTSAPRRARLFDPISWRRTAFAQTEDALILRTGQLVRSAVIVPHGRVQAIEVTAGPWESARRLGSVQFYSTSGPVTARIGHLDLDQAVALAADQATRLSVAMAAAR